MLRRTSLAGNLSAQCSPSDHVIYRCVRRYMDRLGLWGERIAYTDFKDFLSALDINKGKFDFDCSVKLPTEHAPHINVNNAEITHS